MPESYFIAGGNCRESWTAINRGHTGATQTSYEWMFWLCYLNNLSTPTLPTAMAPPTQLVHVNDHMNSPSPGESCVCGAPGRSWVLRLCTMSMC